MSVTDSTSSDTFETQSNASGVRINERRVQLSIAKRSYAQLTNATTGEREHRVGDYIFAESSLLGEGTFGTVYKGRHVTTRQPVAIKRIPAEVNMNKIEIETVRRLHNAHVVNYLTVFHSVSGSSANLPGAFGAVFLVMDLCDTDLAIHIDRHGRLTLDNLRTIASHMADAYVAISERNIVHRDIKSSNILITYEQSINNKHHPNSDQSTIDSDNNNNQPIIRLAQLSDFGCSRVAGPLRKESVVLTGTPMYMAPEVGANIVDHNDYTPALDMWSIGVVLFECATGKLPFSEADLCKLFLRGSQLNYEGFEAPKLDEYETNLRKQDPLRNVITRLLSINPIIRLTPIQFYECVIEGCDIPPDPTEHLLSGSKFSHLSESRLFARTRSTLSQRLSRFKILRGSYSTLNGGALARSETQSTTSSTSNFVKPDKRRKAATTSAQSSPRDTPPPIPQVQVHVVRRNARKVWNFFFHHHRKDGDKQNDTSTRQQRSNTE